MFCLYIDFLVKFPVLRSSPNRCMLWWLLQLLQIQSLFSFFFKPSGIGLGLKCTIWLLYLVSQYQKQNIPVPQTKMKFQNSRKKKKKDWISMTFCQLTLCHMLHLVLLSFMSQCVFCEWAGYRTHRGVPCTVSKTH